MEHEHKGTLLLVEDNIDLNTANSRALRMRGYEVFTAQTAAQARGHLARAEPDIILLDVMLPDGDGFALCEEIRDKTAAHILFLTAKADHQSMMRGLGGGGDDYITKPFHPEELIMRIEAVMRRRGRYKTFPQVLCKGPLALDVAAAQAHMGGKNLKLTPKEFSLLFLLMRHHREALSKTTLYQEVWKQPMVGDGEALWQHMSRLKRKLEEASGGMVTIFSARKEGYSLEITGA